MISRKSDNNKSKLQKGFPKKKKDNVLGVGINNEGELQDIVPGLPYIHPGVFRIGQPIKTEKYQTANLCNPNILYPINLPDVNYGSKMPADCPMARYVQSL